MRILKFVPLVYLIIAIFVAFSYLQYSPSAKPQLYSGEKEGEISIFPITYTLDNHSLGSLTTESKLSGGLGGYFIDEFQQPIQFALIPDSISSSSVSYKFIMEGYGSTASISSLISTTPDAIPGQHLDSSVVYYRRFVEHAREVILPAVGYIDSSSGMPYAKLIFAKLGGNRDNDWSTSVASVNISDIEGHTLNYNSLSDLTVRVFMVPYTKAPTVGTYYNYPESFVVMYSTIKDLDGIWTTAYAVGLNGTVLSKYTVSNTIIIPLGFIYSLDRVEYKVFYLYITSSEPNYLGFGEDLMFPDYGMEFHSSYLPRVAQLPTNMYYPDLRVYYLQPFVELEEDDQGNFVTTEPFRLVLFSPTAQKAYVIAVNLNISHLTTESGYYTTYINAQVSVEQSIDISGLTGGDITKARLMHPDFISPRAKQYGYILARQCVYDSDVLYNPYTYKVYTYSSGSWQSYVLEDVVKKIDYLRPKDNVYPNYNSVHGYVTPYIMDVQYKSQDGVQAQGWVTTLVRFLPYKKYSVTPTKFTYRIQYTYYITPITITYTKEDPSEPDTLNDVLVPINITDPSILQTISTVDAKDVRFFQENTYGGDYWKYSGLTYAIKEITPNYAVFYVLIPSISADSPITIYMYSGFSYASPVASDYYSLVSAYPVLLPQSS